MSDKKVVQFENIVGDAVVGYGAILEGVKDHYRLGTEPFVQTSYVIDIRDGGNTIETKNTIYKRV